MHKTPDKWAKLPFIVIVGGMIAAYGCDSSIPINLKLLQSTTCWNSNLLIRSVRFRIAEVAGTTLTKYLKDQESCQSTGFSLTPANVSNYLAQNDVVFDDVPTNNTLQLFIYAYDTVSCTPPMKLCLYTPLISPSSKSKDVTLTPSCAIIPNTWQRCISAHQLVPK